MKQPDLFDTPIQPIADPERQRVVARTAFYIERARVLFEREFDMIPVLFNLRGRSAGMYVVKGGQRCIRYNPHIFASDFDMGLQITVPHEVAHYITDCLFGLRHIRPHGEEWQRVMQAFGIAQPRATGRYDLSGIPQRRYRRFSYHCDCREHQLSSIRHNKVQNSRARYYCRYCGTTLRFNPDEAAS